jgi:hypothetical protein
MKISNFFSSATAAVFALGVTASVASAETCVIVLPFDFGSAAVSATNQGLLDVIRSKYSNATVDLAGHTDAVGSDASNLALSQRRAQTVDRYLTNGTSITVNNVTGLGESSLKVSDSGPNILNRRVEVTLSDCNPADFGGVPGAALGGLGGAGAVGAVLAGLVIVGALSSSSSTTTTTTTTSGLGSGAGN